MVQEEILDKNLKTLAGVNPGLFRAVSSHDIDPSCNLLGTESGHIAVRKTLENGRIAHSNSVVDPYREARLWADLPACECGTLIVMGFGLGYHVLTQRGRMDPEALMIVIEGSWDLFALSLAGSDLSDVFTHPGCRIFVGVPPETLGAEIHSLDLPPVCIRWFMPAVEMAPAYYHAVRDIIEHRVYSANCGHLPDIHLVEGIHGLIGQLKS